jgi:hypothetical protein
MLAYVYRATLLPKVELCTFKVALSLEMLHTYYTHCDNYKEI